MTEQRTTHDATPAERLVHVHDPSRARWTPPRLEALSVPAGTQRFLTSLPETTKYAHTS